MPMKTVASLIIMVALSDDGLFSNHRNVSTNTAHKIEIMQKDLEENTEFRIKWPRGQLGSLPADS